LTSHWKVRRVPHPDAPDLAELVGDDVTFKRDVVFRRPLVCRVADLARFGDVEVLWDDLLQRGTRQPAFRVVRVGRTIAQRDVTRRAGIGNRDLEDLVAPNAVIERYRGGDTVVLQGLHHTNPHLAKLANNIALALDHPVQINAYLSPPSAQGLDLHFDFHDVFIVQLAGSKRWRVWSPLPRTIAPIKGRHKIAAPRLDELGDPLLDFTMAAGDCLYMPRGHPHAAETVDDHSSHLTIGVVAVTWQRVLRKAIDAEVAAGRLTGALPIGLLDPATAAPSEMVDLAAVAPLTPDILRHWMAREVWRRQPSTRLRPRSVPALSSRRAAFAPGPLLWLITIGDRAVLGLGERLLDMPLEALTFLSNLLDAEEPIAIDQLQGLDDESRDVVLTRLLAEGTLVHVD
jgi:bifunctional lysine-specific demethylase and histidyl-hydroxylase NO66